jgi:hypothetical protein
MKEENKKNSGNIFGIAGLFFSLIAVLIIILFIIKFIYRFTNPIPIDGITLFWSLLVSILLGAIFSDIQSKKEKTRIATIGYTLSIFATLIVVLLIITFFLFAGFSGPLG